MKSFGDRLACLKKGICSFWRGTSERLSSIGTKVDRSPIRSMTHMKCFGSHKLSCCAGADIPHFAHMTRLKPTPRTKAGHHQTRLSRASLDPKQTYGSRRDHTTS